MAYIQGVEAVVSTSYLLARRRVSYFVKVEYDCEGIYVARIRYFLKVVNPRNGSVLRLAVADLFKAEAVEGCLGKYLQVRRPLTQINKRSYQMAVDDISCKLVFCDAISGRQDYMQNVWRFTTYNNTYVKRDPNLA